MPIPESQLETWAKQGSVTQSSDTYATIKRSLEDGSAAYASRNFSTFLQGSYGNDTNIYAESDVDVVIQCNDVFFHDLKELPAEQSAAFHSHFSAGTYPYGTYKSEVEAALAASFGRAVKPGTKAIKVQANGSRRSADVIAAFEYRRYYRFNGASDQSFDSGICFLKSDGSMIANYPKQHSENLTEKNKATGGNFKPVVRIFKNMRSRLVDDGVLEKGVAPSYYVEGLLYNVPNECFIASTYHDIVLNVLKWLHETTDRSKFVCANEQYYLLRDGDDVCWPVANGDAFIGAAIKLWNEW